MSQQRPDPQLLPNGDVVGYERNTQTGEYRTVIVPVGSEHHAAWLARVQDNAPSRRRGKAIGAWLVVILAALAFWWNTGAMDKLLVDVGLNRHPCITSLAGGALCGDDAKRLCSSALFGQAQACRDLRSP